MEEEGKGEKDGEEARVQMRRENQIDVHNNLLKAEAVLHAITQIN